MIREEPYINNLSKYAILGKIKSKIVLPNGVNRVVITGIDRVEIIEYMYLMYLFILMEE